MCLNELVTNYRVACSQFKVKIFLILLIVFLILLIMSTCISKQQKIEKFIFTGLDSESNDIILVNLAFFSF